MRQPAPAQPGPPPGASRQFTGWAGAPAAAPRSKASTQCRLWRWRSRRPSAGCRQSPRTACRCLGLATTRQRRLPLCWRTRRRSIQARSWEARCSRCCLPPSSTRAAGCCTLALHREAWWAGGARGGVVAGGGGRRYGGAGQQAGGAGRSEIPRQAGGPCKLLMPILKVTLRTNQRRRQTGAGGTTRRLEQCQCPSYRLRDQ